MPANMPIPESTEPDAPRPGTGGIYTAITRDYLASVGV
jgi:hypothetical protein